MKLPTLYKKTKTGAIQEWSCCVLNSEIHIQYGQVDGLKTHTIKKCFGKNKGRSNETTDDKQALSEARSLWNKKKEREQYCEDINNCEEVKVSPMLAHDINKHWKSIEHEFMKGFPVYVSPKLDGNRLIVYVTQNTIEYYSRKLVKIETLDHLTQPIKNFIKDKLIELPVYLDGEIYIHGKSLQSINSLLKKKQEGTEALRFNIYDIYYGDNRSFSERFVQKLGFYNKENINIVVSLPCLNKRDIDSSLELYESDGYEGAMIRLDKPYEPGTRSKHLLKYKRFEDSEYKIVGYSYGKDRYEGCIIWKCITEERIEFDILAHGTLEEKKVSNPDDYIGKYVTIKYKDKTVDGIPKFGVIKCFKEDI